MPRRNHTPKIEQYKPRVSAQSPKKRFVSRQAALTAIKELQKYHLELELRVYQSPDDGGWYLTSKT